MPPYVRIRHAEVQWNPEKQLLLQFSITYFMNGSKFFQYIEIVLFVLAVLSLIYAAMRAYRYHYHFQLFIQRVSSSEKLTFDQKIKG